jgi:hypothetical protein
MEKVVMKPRIVLMWIVVHLLQVVPVRTTHWIIVGVIILRLSRKIGSTQIQLFVLIQMVV